MQTEIEKVKMLVTNVDGWLTDREGMLLYRLAQQCTGRGVIVEIGSWKGRSTIWLSKGAEHGSGIHIYAIDPHVGSSEHYEMFGHQIWTFDEFKDNIRRAGVDETVIPLVQRSTEAAEAWQKPVELIFIDGAHEYELVKQDFEVWFPKIIEGGVVALHDTIKSPGPRKVVVDMMFKSKYFRNVRFEHSITYGEKVRQNTLVDRLRNRFRLALKSLYEFANRYQIPVPLRRIGWRLIKFGLK